MQREAACCPTGRPPHTAGVARRMFVALYPPAQVVAELSEQLWAIKREHGDDHAVRWSAPKQWHLTLAFLPKVDEERLSRLTGVLADVATSRGRAPGIAIAGAGRFGGSTLWWALRPNDEAEHWLAQLTRQVRRESRAVGVATDDTRWRPHITIGRVRRDAPSGTAQRWVQALGGVTSREWCPDDVVLVTSVTGPVVSHTATGRWPLGGEV